MLPEQRLNLTVLLPFPISWEQVRSGALAAFSELEEDGLGALDTVKAKSVVVSLTQ